MLDPFRVAWEPDGRLEFIRDGEDRPVLGAICLAANMGSWGAQILSGLLYVPQHHPMVHSSGAPGFHLNCPQAVAAAKAGKYGLTWEDSPC